MIATASPARPLVRRRDCTARRMVVDATFCRQDLDADSMVVDIGLAGAQLKAVLADLNYRNLDDEPAFAGKNTTTEVLAREIFDRLVVAIRDGKLGDAARGVGLAPCHVE